MNKTEGILRIPGGLEEISELGGALSVTNDEDKLSHIDKVICVHFCLIIKYK
jgi:hypothetical protein